MIHLFYCMNRLIKQYCYWFSCYHSKGVNFILSFDQKLFLWFDWYFFSKYINSLYVSYWLFIYIIFCLRFQTSYSKPILFSATAYHRCFISKWQWAIIICFFLHHYSHTIVSLHIFDLLLLYYELFSQTQYQQGFLL